MGVAIPLVMEAAAAVWTAIRNGKRRSVTAFCHNNNVPCMPPWTWRGRTAMHIGDYIIVGALIACMLWAGAMALYKAR